MRKKIITEKTCGKLYIAGEYSILTAGQSAIIKNINIFIKSKIYFSEKYAIFSDMFNYSIILEKKKFENVKVNFDKIYSLICETILTMNEYLKLQKIEPQPFTLEITGKMEKDGKKFGIGSSGSVVILTIKSILSLYDLKISKEIIFKLASYVLLKRGDNGSMGDIACISYENLIYYKSFDREKIGNLIKQSSLENILKINWNYEISELAKNDVKEKNWEFLVGWTKEPAISGELIKIVKKSINENFLENVENIVKKLREGIKTKDKDLIKKCVNENGKLLEKLDKNIYSKKLKSLVNAAENLDICAKSSGAGGGDCGIAISFDKNDTKKIVENWKKSEIELLYSEIFL